jgi:hypothetical protein
MNEHSNHHACTLLNARGGLSLTKSVESWTIIILIKIQTWICPVERYGTFFWVSGVWHCQKPMCEKYFLIPCWLKCSCKTLRAMCQVNISVDWSNKKLVCLLIMGLTCWHQFARFVSESNNMQNSTVDWSIRAIISFVWFEFTICCDAMTLPKISN